jgi:hypothetical protein
MPKKCFMILQFFCCLLSLDFWILIAAGESLQNSSQTLDHCVQNLNMAVVFARDCSRWSWAPYGAVVPSSSQR